VASLKKNAILFATYQIVHLIFPLITFPYVSRLLGPEQIGTVVFAHSIAKYFSVIAALGIPLYGLREISRTRNEPKEADHVFSSLFALNILLNILSLGFYFLLPFLAP